ncbi:hypothetical protein OG266_22715 [Streptomyces sp. NBC_00554]|uniref:hypothetical protein n=1 Tax=Streptomyces sp. NBC_00554 TaxID=2903661 RepID=UPI00352FE668|nr:hypothetical protein OG266_22715 [Streptomyces sp. NBC_00554]
MAIEDEQKTEEEYSITIHGTWAALKRKSEWWRPRGRLFRYLQTNPPADPTEPGLGPVGANLYARWDRFSWTGTLASGARLAGAEDLERWKERHGCHFDKIFAHSHGGNVALDSAQEFETRIDLLILMNTPAHERSAEEWGKISHAIDRILSLRCRFDLVVLSDRGYSAMSGIATNGIFPYDRVRDYPIPNQWFDHSAITHPRVWKGNDLALLVANEAEQVGRLRRP